MSGPGRYATVGTAALALPDGSRVRMSFTWGKNKREREKLSFVPGMLAGIFEPGQAKLHEVLAVEMARRAAVAASQL